MQELYHGSNVAVRKPEIRTARHTLDFGTGFYTTSSFEQAKKWAKNKTDREKRGAPTVSVFAVPDDFLADRRYVVRIFAQADEAWLDFVLANRTDPTFSCDYDVVKGAVANDRVYASLNAFEAGFMDKPTLLAELRAWVYVDQILFHTQRSLELLSFQKEVRL